MTFFSFKEQEIKYKNNNTRQKFLVLPVGQEEEQEGSTLSREPECASKNTQESQGRLVADKSQISLATVTIYRMEIL